MSQENDKGNNRIQQQKFTRELQRRIYGERFVGASLASARSFADETLGEISRWHSNPTSFLILLGPPGVGKTYFCSAMLDMLPKGVQFVRGYSEQDLLQRIRSSFNDGSKGDYSIYLRSLIDDDLIIIDDIGSSGHTDWREEILFNAIDYRYTLKKPTILTSNLTKEEFGDIYSPRLKSRLFAKENLVIEMFGFPDLRQEGL